MADLGQSPHADLAVGPGRRNVEVGNITVSNGFSPESLLSGGLLKVLAADPYGVGFQQLHGPGRGPRQTRTE